MKILYWLVSLWFRTLCRMGFHRFEYSIDPKVSCPDRAMIECQRCGQRRPECAVSSREAVKAHISSNNKADRDPEYKSRWMSFKCRDEEWDHSS